MSDPIRLVTSRDDCNRTAIDTLRALLAEAEAGYLVAVIGVRENSDGTYSNFGSATMSRLQTAGALMETAMLRLGFPQ